MGLASAAGGSGPRFERTGNMQAPREARQVGPEWTESVLGRRQGPRVAMDLSVQLGVSGLPGLLSASSREIGTGGACVATQTPFALNSLDRIVIELPGGPTTLPAEGRWQREVPDEHAILTGVQFSHPHPETVRSLWKFLQERAQALAQFLEDRSELAELAIDELLQLTLSSRCRKVPAGQLVYAQGSEGAGTDSIFVVLQGSVVFEMESSDRRRVELCRGEAGAVFGGLPLVSGLPHVESAVAVYDLLLLEINAYSVHYLEVMNPSLARLLTRAAVRAQTVHLRHAGDR